MNRTSPKAQPAARGLFYAIALTAVSMLAGCDELAAAHAQAVDQVAEQQAREALSRRERAASEICQGKAHEWAGTVLICHQER